MLNTERTVPSTDETNYLEDKLIIRLDNKNLKVHIYDTPLGKRWLSALKENLRNNLVLEKNFCWLGWADSQRNLKYLVSELNENIEQINSFDFTPAYDRLQTFTAEDFQYPESEGVGREIDGDFNGLKLKHESCNLLHRYFEDLQGTAWQLSEYYRQADYKTKYAIRQLNNLCHEIEGWVVSYRKSKVNPEWIRPAQITTFLNAPRHDLHEEDFELFKQNRYKRELGGVYLHWSQVGKTLFEVFRDEGDIELDEATCSAINHQKYYSGEFDIEWGQTIDEDTFDFKKQEMENYRQWLKKNSYDWEDPKLSLGYIKLGQIDMQHAFGDKQFSEIYVDMLDNLNIKKIETIGTENVIGEYPYNLSSDNWKQIQIDNLRKGYESRNLC